jgi:hypothetical protein
MTRFKFPLARFSLSQDSKCIARHEGHEAVLDAREAALNAGRVTVSDWEEAKERIKKNVTGYGDGAQI